MEKAVLEVFNEKILAEAASRYGIGSEDLIFIRDFENFVYEFSKDNEKYIMRLAHSSHRNREMIEGEANWIKYLYDKGARVSSVIDSNNNGLVETIEADNSSFFVTVFEKAPGKEVDRKNPEEWNDKLFETWGQVVGNFNRLSKSYIPDPGAPLRPQWFEDDLVKNAGKYLSPLGQVFARKQKKLMDYMHALPRDCDSYGLIHSDVHDGNFFIDGGEMTVFDFDDCNYNWYMNDAAIVLFYILFREMNVEIAQRRLIAQNFMNCFWRGYNKENKLEAKWFEHISLFLKFREMLVFTVLCKKWDINNLNEKQSELFNYMKYNIENDVPYI